MGVIRRPKFPYHRCVQGLPEKVLRYIRERELMKAGDRVGVAVSAGADSVALLRLMLGLRQQLGIVLAVVHLNHGLRGAESDADAELVATLARTHALELFSERADAHKHALNRKLSLEAAGRELRYQFFTKLGEQGKLDCVATAHTRDDQAETVLLRLLRGAWTRGLAGIYPERPLPKLTVVRPLLKIGRSELRAYLPSLGQNWREDASNNDLRFARNRVRHQLLPLLQRDYNPRIAESLAETAELARAEEDFWEAEVRRRRAQLGLPEADSAVDSRPIRFDFDGFAHAPIAVQRRVLRGFAPLARLEFRQIEKLRQVMLSPDRSGRELQLPGGLRVHFATRELRFVFKRLAGPPASQPQRQAGEPFSYRLRIPGTVAIAELETSVSALLLSSAGQTETDTDRLLSPAKIGNELIIRNWHPGDRFWPAHTRAPEKLKRLLSEHHVSGPERRLWPVAEAGGKLVWVRGFPVAADLVERKGGPALLIREIPAAK